MKRNYLTKVFNLDFNKIMPIWSYFIFLVHFAKCLDPTINILAPLKGKNFLLIFLHF